MTNKYILPPLTKTLLQLIAEVGQAGVDFYTMLYDLKYHRGWYRQGGHGNVLEMKRLYEKKYAQQALDQLKRSNFVKTNRLGKKLMVTLTKKGVEHTLITKLRQSPKSNHGYTVVIFDIPQSQNQARRQFRWLLKQGGFKKLQQSVWVSEADNHRLLSEFIENMKLESWINVFYGTNFFKLHL